MTQMDKSVRSLQVNHQTLRDLCPAAWVQTCESDVGYTSLLWPSNSFFRAVSLPLGVRSYTTWLYIKPSGSYFSDEIAEPSDANKKNKVKRIRIATPDSDEEFALQTQVSTPAMNAKTKSPGWCCCSLSDASTTDTDIFRPFILDNPSAII